jgi:hypothetical protein
MGVDCVAIPFLTLYRLWNPEIRFVGLCNPSLLYKVNIKTNSQARGGHQLGLVLLPSYL